MSGQRVLSYPFRFDIYNSRLGTVNSDSDTHKAEQINAFLKTEKGETNKRACRDLATSG